MTTKVEKEEKLAEPPQKPEKKFDPSEYSCEILQEKTTHEKANDRKLPSDAFNVTYVVEGETLLDVTRSSKMVNVFDMYYDCLLYTSPSPRDVEESRMPSSA